MSFGKLREYIDSCLSGVNSDHANPLRTKEEFLQLCDILRAKAVEPLLLPKLQEDTKLPLLPDEPPPFPAFKPSERLIGLERELSGLQMELSQKSADRRATKRSIKKLEHKIQFLKDDLEPLKRREIRSYQEANSAYYKPYRAQLDIWKSEKRLYDKLSQEKVPSLEMLAQHERSRQEKLRFVDRIKKDIERKFTFGINAPIYRVFWRVLPAGEWTFDSVLNHYTELHRAYPHIHFEVDRLRRVFSLNPSSLYIGIDEFDWYIVCAFSETTKVVLECPIYGNAIYVIRENWQSLSKLPKNELLSQFPSYVHRIVHAGDWYPLLCAELFA